MTGRVPAVQLPDLLDVPPVVGRLPDTEHSSLLHLVLLQLA